MAISLACDAFMSLVFTQMKDAVPSGFQIESTEAIFKATAIQKSLKHLLTLIYIPDHSVILR